MLNFDFLEMGLGTVFSKHNILSMVFREKYFSFYILLTDQILLPECLFLLTYWSIWVLLVNHAATS